ncbi:DNA sulfur modification protein DndB, partial [Verrucomicrobiota bacterium]
MRIRKRKPKHRDLWLPCLRGVMGDWVFYSALFPLAETARRISYADELHPGKELSEMIQRHLKEGRADEIAEYLKNQKQRFFNSLVVAVYKGAPSWHDIGHIACNIPGVSVTDIPNQVLNSFGLLRLTGAERLFAIDGQHRLAGIKAAMTSNSELGSEEVSVLLVAHQNSPSGLERTRRLFTTLNKRAEAVSKGETIALDEDDVMAIIARRLVESHPFFTADRLALAAGNNLPPSDHQHLTTIGNLYDVLGILLSRIKGKCDLADLKYFRPSEKELDQYHSFTKRYFDLLYKHNQPLQEFWDARDFSQIVKKYRGPFGGNVFFRPIGMTVITEAVAQLANSCHLSIAVRRVSELPQDLTGVPYVDVLW